MDWSSLSRSVAELMQALLFCNPVLKLQVSVLNAIAVNNDIFSPTAGDRFP